MQETLSRILTKRRPGHSCWWGDWGREAVLRRETLKFLLVAVNGKEFWGEIQGQLPHEGRKQVVPRSLRSGMVPLNTLSLMGIKGLHAWDSHILDSGLQVLR